MVYSTYLCHLFALLFDTLLKDFSNASYCTFRLYYSFHLYTHFILSLRSILYAFRPSICSLFLFTYASTPCRTSGSMIRHLLYDVMPFTKFVRSFHMYCTFGNTPASLYFQIRYFMHIFISIYSTVASMDPSSLPLRSRFYLPSRFFPSIIDKFPVYSSILW